MLKIIKQEETALIKGLSKIHLGILKIGVLNIYNGSKNTKISTNEDFEKQKAIEDLLTLFKMYENEN